MKSTMIPTLPHEGRAPASPDASVTFRQPAYDCREHRDGMKLTVYVPGVDGHGIEIEGRGADLTVIARKPHVWRVNFNALHLEAAQRDYRLKLRLGTDFDFARMSAEITGGVLSITLPKRVREHPGQTLRRVA
jgi:HSP20 family protein